MNVASVANEVSWLPARLPGCEVGTERYGVMAVWLRLQQSRGRGFYWVYCFVFVRLHGEDLKFSLMSPHRQTVNGQTF